MIGSEASAAILVVSALISFAWLSEHVELAANEGRLAARRSRRGSWRRRGFLARSKAEFRLRWAMSMSLRLKAAAPWPAASNERSSASIASSSHVLAALVGLAALVHGLLGESAHALRHGGVSSFNVSNSWAALRNVRAPARRRLGENMFRSWSHLCLDYFASGIRGLAPSRRAPPAISILLHCNIIGAMRENKGFTQAVSTFLAVGMNFSLSPYAKWRIRLNLVDESSTRPETRRALRVA